MRKNLAPLLLLGLIGASGHEPQQKSPTPENQETRLDFTCVKGQYGWQPKAKWSGVHKGTYQVKDYPALGAGGMSEQQCKIVTQKSRNGIVCTNTRIGWKPTHFSGYNEIRKRARVPDADNHGYYGTSIDNFDDCVLAARFSSAKGVCFAEDKKWKIGNLAATSTNGEFPNLRACLNEVSPGWEKEQFPSSPFEKKSDLEAPQDHPKWATQLCTECHGNTEKELPTWATHKEVLEKRLADPETQTEARKWMSKLYEHLVLAKDMPPQNYQAGLASNPEAAKFVEFLEKAHAKTPAAAPEKIGALHVEKSDAQLAEYDALLPHLSSPEMEKLLREGFPYDLNSLPVAYQDTSRSVIGVRGANAGTVKAIQSEFGVAPPYYHKGKLRFWSHGAGMDPQGATRTYGILSLPTDDKGELKKIEYWINTPGGLEDAPKWHWRFPPGTVSAENLYATNKDQKSLVIEVRTRTKASWQAKDWNPNIWRPFVTKEELLTALEEVGQQKPELKEETAHVAETIRQTKLTPVTVDKEGFNNLPTISGYTFKIPHMTPDLVKTLVKDRPFKPALGTVFAVEGDKKAFGATTEDAFGIVPQNSTQGAIEITKASCNRCHDRDDQPLIEAYEGYIPPENHARYSDAHRKTTFGYGNSPGNDGNLRWHLFDPRLLNNMGVGNGDNRAIRPAFKKLLTLITTGNQNPKPAPAKTRKAKPKNGMQGGGD